MQNVAATTAGIYQSDSDGAVNVRGSRSNATAYYIDGIKITGNSNVLPQSAIDQMTVVTGGLPAQYGDATGGIISITTRGPSRITKGGFEIGSSQLTDPYNHNLIGFNLSGPIWRKKDADKTPILGYLITGEYNHKLDPDPSAIGVPVLMSDVLDSLQLNPLEFIGTPTYGSPISSYSLNSAEQLTEEDWTIQDVKQNLTDEKLQLRKVRC